MASISNASKLNPFRRLEPYRESEPIYGRDSDLVLLKDRVFSSRTTLLFSSSGAGKTSFLQAKALPAFRQFFCCCYHRDWTEQDPRTALIASIAGSLNLQVAATEGQSLRQLLMGFRQPDEGHREGFLLVLDQFEELFQSHAFDPRFEDLIQELCQLLNSLTIRVRVIISMRDDFLGELGVFDNRIPDLFNNYFHLKSPDDRQAREIIRRTAQAVANTFVQPEKLCALTDQLSCYTIGAVGKVILAQKSDPAPASLSGSEQGSPEEARNPGRSGKLWQLLQIPWRRWPKPPTVVKRNAAARMGRRLWQVWKRWFMSPHAPAVPPMTVKRDTVLLPYLQIVCWEIWNREWSSNQEKLVFLDSWDPKKDGARTILDTSCRQTLDSLGTTRKRDIASRAFDFLMTREGAKLPYECNMLAEHMGEDEEELYDVLHHLSAPQTRILREYKKPDGSTWFELYHDMYAILIHDWKRTYQSNRVRQRRRKLGGTAAAVVLGFFAALVTFQLLIYTSRIEATPDDPPLDAYEKLQKIRGVGWAFRPYANNLLAAYWDRRAQKAGVDEDAAKALFFSLKGEAVKDGAVRRTEADALMAAFQGLKATLRNDTHAEISALAFSPDESLIAVGSTDGVIQVWETDQARYMVSLQVNNCNPVKQKRKTPQKTPQKPAGRGGMQPAAAPAVDPIRELTFSEDGARLAVLTASGLAQVWNIDLKHFDAGSGDDVPGKCYHEWPGASILTFANSKHASVVASPAGLIQIWADSTPGWATTYPLPKARYQFEAAAISSIAYLTEKRTIFAADTKGGVYSWSVQPKTRKADVVVKGDAPAVFTADAKMMATFVHQQVELWDLVKMHRVLKLETGEFEDFDSPSLTFAPDGKVVAVQSSNRLQIFNGQTGSLQFSLPITSPLDVRLGRNGKVLLRSPSGSAALVDLGTRKMGGPLPQFGSTMAFSTSSSLLATGSSDGVVSLWDVQQQANLHMEDAAQSVSMSSDGKLAALAKLDDTIEIREVFTGKVKSSIHPGSRLITYAISPDGLILAGVDQDLRLSLWSSGKKVYEELLTFATLTSPVWRIHFNQDIVSLLGTREPALSQVDSDLRNRGMVFSPDGQILLVRDGRTWHSVSMVNHQWMAGGALPDGAPAAFSPDSKALVWFGREGTKILQSKDLNSIGQSKSVEPLPQMKLKDSSVPRLYYLGSQPWFDVIPTPAPYAFSPEGRLVALYNDKRIQVLDWQTAQTVGRFDVPDRPLSIAFRPGKGREILAVYANAVRLKNLADAKSLEQEIRGNYGFLGAYFRPTGNLNNTQDDGDLVTFSRNGVIQLWNLGDGKPRGIPVNIAYRFTNEPWFSADGYRMAIIAPKGWLHAFRIGPAGLLPDGNRALGGQTVSRPSFSESGKSTLLATVLRIGPFSRLSVLPITDSGTLLKGEAATLAQDYQKKLSLDQRGNPASLGFAIAPSERTPEKGVHPGDSK